jgi:uncharacterized protein YjiS (DUF1127 family)
MLTLAVFLRDFRIPPPPIHWLLPERDVAFDDLLTRADDRLLDDIGLTRHEAMGMRRYMWADRLRRRRA